MKKIIFTLIGIIGFSGVAYGLPYFSSNQTLLPFADSLYDLGTSTKAWRNLYIDQICLSGDCKTIWPTGSGGYPDFLGQIGDVSTTTLSNGYVLKWNSSTAKWESVSTSTLGLGGSSGTVSSVAQTVPTGFTITGSPITSAGTLAIGFDTGYFLPTTTRASTWDTAYSWGNHALAGYLPQSLYYSTTTHNTLTTIPNLSITKSQVSDFGTYQAPISLTTTGTSGASTFDGTTLNIPQYAGTTYTATYPVTLTGSAFGLAFGTSTSNTWGGTQAFTNTANFNTWTNNGSATTTNLAISALTGVLVGNGSTKPISVAVSGTDFKTINGNSILGSGDLTISGGAGLSTSSPISSSNLLVYSSSGAGSAYGVATSTLTVSSPLTGSFTQIGTGGSLGCQTASGSQAGCLSSTDWTTFNGKQDALGYTPLNQALYYSTTTFTSLTTAPNLSITKSQVSDFGTYENPLTFTYPLQRSVNTISSALTTTTANIWSGLQSFTNVGTTTFAGGIEGTYLNITGTAATSTFARGINLSGGCFAVNGICVGGGSGLTSYDAWTHPLLNLSATTSQMLFGTTTANNYQLTIASSTAPQISLSDGTGIAQWTMRNAGGNLYIATTTVAGTATTTTAVFEATSATTTVRNVIDEKTFIVGDGTNTITTGAYASVQVPYNAKIMEWSIVSDDAASTACSIVIDVWKDTYANYPPTVTDTITASAKPTLSSANKNSGSAGTWNSTITEGDFLKFNVDSVTSCTHITLKLKLKRQ